MRLVALSPSKTTPPLGNKLAGWAEAAQSSSPAGMVVARACFRRRAQMAKLFHESHRGAARILSLPLCSIICSALLYAAWHVHAADDDWTVVTIARHGPWGVATASSQSQAIATAIRDCKAMADTPSDCGAMFTTIRGGWTLAKLCGDEKIIETGKTLQEAEQAAFDREMDLSLFYVPALPPCRRVLMVDPHGTIVGPDLQRARTR